MFQIERNQHKFLQKPDEDLKCVICLDVARDPQQHDKCGKLFCLECLERYGENKPCPHCKMENWTFFSDQRGKVFYRYDVLVM